MAFRGRSFGFCSHALDFRPATPYAERGLASTGRLRAAGRLDGARRRLDNPPVNRQIPLLLPILALLLGLPASRTDAAEYGVAILVRPLEGKRLGGTLTRLDGATLEFATPGGDRRLDLGDVLEVEFPIPPGSPDADADRLRLHLVGGETLYGTFAGGTEEGLALATSSGGRVLLPFEAIRAVVRVPASAGPCYEPESRFGARPGQDVVVLDGGDTYEGLLLAVDERGFRLEMETGAETTLGWVDVLVVHLDNEVPPASEGLHVEIETRDGCRWQGAALPVLAGDALRFPLRSSPKTVVTLPLNRVAVLRPSGARFVHACHLPFESTLETPYDDGALDETEAVFLEAWFGTRVDRRPSGCPLRLKGRVVRHGFAVHSRSRVTIPLEGAWRTFRATFGVDDEAASEGGVGGVVDARVLVDGEEAWAAKGVRVGETPRTVGPIDVEGAAQLVLEVDYGPELNVRDRATWAEPVLVR